MLETGRHLNAISINSEKSERRRNGTRRKKMWCERWQSVHELATMAASNVNPQLKYDAKLHEKLCIERHAAGGGMALIVNSIRCDAIEMQIN